jgi:hypothetical protein
MNKEQQELLDDAYKNYAAKTSMDVDGQYTKEEFIDKIKTDDEFAKTWGLKIEEREVSGEERMELYQTGNYTNGSVKLGGVQWEHKWMDTWAPNVPTKLITVTYNNKTIESYE